MSHIFHDFLNISWAKRRLRQIRYELIIWFGDVLVMFWLCFGDVLAMFWGCFGDVLAMFWTYVHNNFNFSLVSRLDIFF